jgi:hypothetical protein
VKRDIAKEPQAVASLYRWLVHLFGPDWTDVQGIGGRYVDEKQMSAAIKEWKRLNKQKGR